ncbi:MAG: serine hydrolase domain-containing protein [Bacteroidota bacterium]
MEKSLFLVFLILIATSKNVVSQEIENIEDLQEMIDQDFDDGHFAGAVVGILVGDEKIIATGGFKDLENELRFQPTTLGRIASIAKPMTSVAALQLYEQGKLDLDVPISTYLPDYPKRYAEKITTRNLLQHSSGIGAYESKKEVESATEYATLAEAAMVFQERELVDEPGKAEHYTTYGYVVLGMVIEAISGMNYEAYMKENIWSPIGMKNTGVEKFADDYANKSKLYSRSKKGKIKEVEQNNLSNRVPGGGFYSTASDLLKFGKAIINNELVSSDTYKMMTTEPSLPYEGNPYGMGWFLYGENPTLGNVIGHGGAQTGCSSVLFVFPEKNAVITVISNTSKIGDHVFGMAIKSFKLIEELSTE